MKKIFLSFCCVVFAMIFSAHAEIIVFEYNGKQYYIEDIEKFFGQENMKMCVDGVGGPEKVVDTLLNACADGLREMNTWFAQKRDELWMKVLGGKEGLRYCLVRKEELQKELNPYAKYDYSYSLSGSISACVSKIGIHADDSTCPIGGFYVPDESYLDGFDGVGAWTGKAYSFKKSVVANPLVAAFNGRIMVVCDNGNPAYLLKPTFSGRDSCKDNMLQSVPGFGKTPDGVYLARYADLDTIEEPGRLSSWGGYRIPLLPSKQTNTFDRTSMYLHGTSDASKHRSAGCISMGTLVDDFVDSYFKSLGRDMIIVVSGASQIDEAAIERDIKVRNKVQDQQKLENIDKTVQEFTQMGVVYGEKTTLLPWTVNHDETQ